MKKNKIIALFMAFIMIFSTLVVPVSEVFAANVKWGKHIVTGYWVHKTTNPLDIKVINGERAFCVEPGASVTTIKGYSQKKPKYSASLWKKLVRIAHVGYNKDNNTKADFAATQVFLWNTINEAKGKKVDWSPTTNIPNYKKKFADIRAGLKDLDKLITTKPSFNKKNVTVSVGESVTLTDTNKVLSKGYKLVNVPDGITASISGNKLILKASVKAPNEFTLNLRLPDKNMVSDNRYFYHPSSQDVGHVGFIDPNYAKITVKVNKYGKAQVTKKSESGKYIKGAKFNIKNASGSVNKTSTTNSKGQILFSNLKPGTYYVKETYVPKPYLLDTKSKTIEVKANEITEVPFENKLPRGHFILKKTKENGQPLVGAKFKIWSVGNDPEGKVIGFNKTLTTNSKGEISVTGLKLGNYKYQEIAAPDGYVLDKTVKDFSITYENSSKEVITVPKTVMNKMPRGKFTLTKKAVDKTPLAGAEYKIWSVGNDPEGKVIDYNKTLKTDSKGQITVTGLKLGTYKYQEVKAPSGYVLDKTVRSFTLKYQNQNTAVVGLTAERIDKKVEAEKLNINNKLVAGAELKVIDKDGKVVDSWTSTNAAHKINNLKEDESYTLVEDYAPDGFVLAKPVKFTVTDKKENQTISMVDKQVEFVKTDVDGNALSGMEYTVTNNKSKEIVDKGVTSAKSRNFLNGLKVGETYTITETKVPTGFAHAKPIEFTVTDDNKLQTVTMKDKQVVVKKTDIGGENVVGAELKVIDKETGDVIDSWTVKENEPEHIVKGLVEGKEYTLVEDYAPDGFTISNEVDFTVTEDKVNQTITMIDKVVDVDKVNFDGESLKGVKLQVVNNKTKQIVDEWITNGTPHKVSLVEGMEYTLIELESIDGYALAKPVKFTVTSDKETQHIVMTDKKVQFKKLGLNNKTLTGGKFEIKDKETKKVVDTLSAEKKFIDVNNLVEGKTYIIHEVEAPKGYKIGEDVEFTVSYDKKTQKLVMKDVPDEGRIIVTDDDDFDQWELVKTGDNFGLAMLVILLIASVVGTLFLGTDRKKKHK